MSTILRHKYQQVGVVFVARSHFKTAYNALSMRKLFLLFTMVRRGNSARGRADGAIWSTVDRGPVGKDPALAPPKAPAPARRAASGRRPQSEGILWILRSGARWQDLPEEFPSPSTCWRRLPDWEEQGVWLAIWRSFLSELNERQQLKWSEAFLDGSFAPAKKGALESAKPSGARARSGWWWSTARVFLWETTFTLRPVRAWELTPDT